MVAQAVEAAGVVNGGGCVGIVADEVGDLSCKNHGRARIEGAQGADAQHPAHPVQQGLASGQAVPGGSITKLIGLADREELGDLDVIGTNQVNQEGVSVDDAGS